VDERCRTAETPLLPHRAYYNPSLAAQPGLADVGGPTMGEESS
jgi:hypothetical protein